MSPHIYVEVFLMVVIIALLFVVAVLKDGRDGH